MVLCGDLTDYGLPEETEILSRRWRGAAKRPTIAVLGNHDFESGREAEVRRMLVEAGVMMLDGDAVEVMGIGFAGAKGFAGGFGRGTLGAWGEPAIKIVRPGGGQRGDEARGGARPPADRPRRIAVLHYSPIRATVENEPVEIFPFLGCSRLEDPLNRYPVTAVVHGHAHNGAPEGTHQRRGPRVQRLAAAAPQDLPRPAALPTARGARSRRRCRRRSRVVGRRGRLIGFVPPAAGKVMVRLDPSAGEPCVGPRCRIPRGPRTVQANRSDRRKGAMPPC